MWLRGDLNPRPLGYEPNRMSGYANRFANILKFSPDRIVDGGQRLVRRHEALQLLEPIENNHQF